MKNYKISIIIPTYNRAWCIENAIKSVINQNYDNWELFIIDDGSEDDTKDIVNKFLDEKVKYYYKENSGKLPSVNYGINNLISGDILFILDSDDEFLPGILQYINKEFNKNNSFVSYHYKCKFPEHIINRKSELLEKNKSSVIVNYKKLLLGKSHKGDFPGFINIYKFGKINFEEKCSNGLENIFWLRLCKLGDSLYINREGFIIDSSRKKENITDNLTSYSFIYRRAKSMIVGFDILIEENIDEVLKVNKNILSKWYSEQFQWCIIDRQLKTGFISWKNAIKYGDIKNKIKIIIFGILFLIPKIFLPTVLKIYYKTK